MQFTCSSYIFMCPKLVSEVHCVCICGIVKTEQINQPLPVHPSVHCIFERRISSCWPPYKSNAGTVCLELLGIHNPEGKKEARLILMCVRKTYLHNWKRTKLKFLSLVPETCLFGKDIIGEGSHAGGVGDEVSDWLHDVP